MATITIENVPESIVKTIWTRIRYTKDFVFPVNNDIEDMTLLEYINSDEYKNEESINFTPEEFLSDLKKYKN